MKTFTLSRGFVFLAVVVFSVVLTRSSPAQLDIGRGLDLGQKLFKGAEKLGKAFEKMDPAKEYQLGRAIAARLASLHNIYRDEKANRYVNEVGQTLAQFCDTPEVYHGYHFQILDTDEVNAFAAPGAFIFVTRGLLKLCETEDQLAAVLAHEIGHVQHRHAIQAIQKSRQLDLLAFGGTMAMSESGDGDVKQFSEAMGKAADEGVGVLNKGFSRDMEKEADAAAVVTLTRTGYDPNAMIAVFEKLAKQPKQKSPGLFKTHPKPEDRIKDVKKLIPAGGASPAPASRAERFNAALGQARG